MYRESRSILSQLIKLSTWEGKRIHVQRMGTDTAWQALPGRAGSPAPGWWCHPAGRAPQARAARGCWQLPPLQSRAELGSGAWRQPPHPGHTQEQDRVLFTSPGAVGQKELNTGCLCGTQSQLSSVSGAVEVSYCCSLSLPYKWSLYAPQS